MALKNPWKDVHNGCRQEHSIKLQVLGTTHVESPSIHSTHTSDVAYHETDKANSRSNRMLRSSASVRNNAFLRNGVFDHDSGLGWLHLPRGIVSGFLVCVDMDKASML
jgi:hypothetical protein